MYLCRSGSSPQIQSRRSWLTGSNVLVAVKVGFDRLDIWLPRVQVHFDFHKPLVFDDLIEVSAYVGRFGSKSLTLQFEVTKKGETDLVAGGHIVLACVNRSTFQSVSVPSEIIENLGPY